MAPHPFANALKSGVFPYPDHDTGLETAATSLGLKVVTLDLHGVKDAAGFYKVAAAAMKFPAHFGHNADAFLDSLRDLSWLPAPGWLVVVKHGETLRGKDVPFFLVTLNLFAEASLFWRGQKKPFWALIHGPAAKGLDMKPFPS